jgi:hypothetical protein
MICSWSSHPWQNNLLGEQFLREGERNKARKETRERERVRKGDNREDVIERERISERV